MPSAPTNITHVGTEFESNTEGFSDSSTLTVSVPAGTQNGDLLIMSIFNSQAGSTEEGTWTQLYQIDVSTTLRARVLYRIASSEPADYDVVRGTGNTWGVAISSFRGINQTTPINTSANNPTTHGSAPTSITAPNVTTTAQNCKIVTFLATRSSTLTEATFSSGDTQLADWGFDNGTNPRNGYLAFSSAKSQGSVTGLTMTRDSGTVTAAVAFSIALNPATTYTENPSDSLTINDYPSGVTHDVDHVENESDTLTLADTVTKVHSASRPQSDTETLSDTSTRTYSGSRSLDDTVTLSDTIATARAISLSVSDTLTLSDSHSAARGYVLSFVEDSILIGVTEADYSKGYGATASDTETLSDLAEPGEFDGNHERNADDTLALDDSVSFTGSFVRDLAEVLDLSDTVSPVLATVSNQSDTVDLADSVSFTLSKGVQDDATLSDTTSEEASFVRSLSDDEDLSDTVTRVASYQRSFSDVEDLSEEVTSETGVHHVTDVLTLSDSISITHVDVDDTDTIGNYTATLVQGPASVYVGDFGAAEPQTIFDILAEPNEDWQAVGGTLDGVELEVAKEYEDAEFIQVPDMPVRRLKRRRLAAKTVLAEPTLQNILYGLNGGTLTSGSGYQSYVPGDLDEATPLDYRAVMLYGWAPGEGQDNRAKRRVVIMRKCLSIDNVEMSYKKEDQTGLSVTWAVHRVDEVTAPFLIIDEE